MPRRGEIIAALRRALTQRVNHGPDFGNDDPYPARPLYRAAACREALSGLPASSSGTEHA